MPKHQGGGVPKETGEGDVQNERQPHRLLEVTLHDELFGQGASDQIKLGKTAPIDQGR